MFCLGMTEDEWNDAVERFNLSPEEAADYQEAFRDLERLGLEKFIDLVFNESLAALVKARAGQPPDAATLRRCQARKTVVVEFVGGEDAIRQHWQQQALAAYDGPAH
jgi:hypothetical protein